MRKFSRLLILVGGLVAVVTGTAQATPIYYTASLSGPNEAPPNTSAGTGFAVVSYDALTHLLGIDVTFQGLTGTTTASHIHCCTVTAGTGTAGVATTTPTFAGFPLGVMSGTYSNVLDLTMASSYNPAFITANSGSISLAEIALINGIGQGRTYLNIHTSAFPGGEIRGFLAPAAVPEPASLVLIGTGLTVLAVRHRHRRGRKE